MRWPTLSIRSTVLVATAAAVLLPTLLWNVEQKLTREAQMPLIEQCRTAVLVMAAAGLVEAMWTIDERATDAAARKTLDEPSVLSLRPTEQLPGSKPLVIGRPGAPAGQGVPLWTRVTREGEALGDLLLVTLATRLRDALRASDVVCRHGGDEFTALLHDAARWDGVAAAAGRMLKAVEAPVRLHGRDVAISARIGIALCPDDAADHDALARHADSAMYAAKNLGRARHSFFRAEFNAQLLASRLLGQDMVRALEQRDLLHQPGNEVLQGCRVSRPQPAAALERFVSELGAAEAEVIEATTWAG